MLKYVGEDTNDYKENKNKDGRDSTYSYDELIRVVPWHRKLLLNRPIKIFITAFIITVVLPPVIYFLMFIANSDSPPDQFSIGSCSHATQHRIQCGLHGTNETECPANCCFDYRNERCYHRLPSRYNYIWNADTAILRPRFLATPYDRASNLQRLRLRTDEIDPDHLNIIIYDETVHNYSSQPERRLEDKNYDYNIFQPEFFISVYSIMDGREVPILTTMRGPFIASENIWEWTIYLSEGFNYGLNSVPIRNQTSKILYNNPHTGFILPVIAAYKDGSFHALVVQHSGPLELTFSESNLLIMKSILGQSLSIHMFVGPKPKDITRQIMGYFGTQSEIEYWMLGVHFCRSNLTETVEEALELESQFRSKMLSSNVPYESDCIDADFISMMNSPALNADMELIRNYVQLLREDSKRFVAAIVPYLLADINNTTDDANNTLAEDNNTIYQIAVAADVLVLEPDTIIPIQETKTYIGSIKNVDVAYFNYYAPGIQDFVETYWPLKNLTDGYYLRDNWPLNEELSEKYRVYEFPYFTDDFYDAFNSTLPWNALLPGISNGSNLHMANHNGYGKAQGDTIRNMSEYSAEPKKTPLIFTSSTCSGDKSIYAPQEVLPLWTSFKEMFVSVALGSLTGMLQAPPVCGDSFQFNNTMHEHLCLKWYLASTFLPVFRVHSNDVDRSPLEFTGHIRNAMAKAIRIRYQLLPYYYRTVKKREPLLRPMFYDFYDDERVLDIDDQFMVGKALMIAPNFLPRQVSVNVTLPAGEIWYIFWDGRLVDGTREAFTIIPTTETDIPAFVLAGHIIPTHETVHETADQTRQNSNYTLIIALRCINDACQANGDIQITTMEHVELTATADNTTIWVRLNSASADPKFCERANTTEISISTMVNSVKVYGLEDRLNNFEFFYYVTDLNANICNVMNNTLLTLNYN